MAGSADTISFYCCPLQPTFCFFSTLISLCFLFLSLRRVGLASLHAHPLASSTTAAQEEAAAAAAAATPAVSAAPSAEEVAASAAAAEASATATAAAATDASASVPAAAIGGYMRAAGQLKLREEADSFSLEVGTVSRGQLVKVEEVSGRSGG